MENRIVVEVDEDLECLFPDYLNNKEVDVQKILTALKAEDFDSIKRIAHTIKGSGAGYGFDYITECGIQIENAASRQAIASTQEWTQKLRSYLQQVEVVFVEVDF
ncbi:MAG: Hpt protein [SAR324 cluster bacterium]|uniref:Hpt protein n=1 Tax=SAR324 cluster bacterium TaxID=2024889 RepID=A0A2A4T5Y2_9DELT|nr:MAG: Hpt protein [SAR324 cluster bacterium]